jgi:hypothetical protein
MEQMLEWAADNGFALLFSVVVLYLIVRGLELAFRWARLKIDSHVIDFNKIELQSHSFWSRVGQFLRVDLPAAQVNHPFKRAIALHVTTQYWEAIVATMRQLVSGPIDETPGEDMLALVLKELQDCITQVYQTLKEDGVPGHVLLVMRRHHVRSERILFAQIASFFRAQLLINNRARLFHVMNLLNYNLEAELPEIEDLFNDMNGQLEGATFKGLRYEHPGTENKTTLSPGA